MCGLPALGHFGNTTMEPEFTVGQIIDEERHYIRTLDVRPPRCASHFTNAPLP